MDDEQRLQDIKNAGIKSRHAMAWLRDHRLPADPVCYTLAYEYLHTENPVLKKKVDAIDFNKISSIDELHQVYKECIIAEEYKKLAMANENINMYVAEILNLLLKSQHEIQDFRPILSAVNQQIEAGRQAQQAASAYSQPPSSPEPEEELMLAGSPDDYLEVMKIASKDAMTGLLDLEGGKRVIEVATQYAENYPVGFLKIDVDKLKVFADTHGQFMAQGVIKHTARTLASHLKGSDILCYLGDDEFLVMMPKTSKDLSLKVAEKLRKIIAALTLKKKAPISPLSLVFLSVLPR